MLHNNNLTLAMKKRSTSVFELSVIMGCDEKRAFNILYGKDRPTNKEMCGVTSFFRDTTIFHGMSYENDDEPFDPAVRIRTLMNSCVEGRTGEWDSSSEEGRESFRPMYDSLKELARHFKIKLNRVRRMP